MSWNALSVVFAVLVLLVIGISARWVTARTEERRWNAAQRQFPVVLATLRNVDAHDRTD
jgi:hypothetical protein